MRPIYAAVQTTVSSPEPTNIGFCNNPTASNKCSIQPNDSSNGCAQAIKKTTRIRRENSTRVYQLIGQFERRQTADSAVRNKIKAIEEQIALQSSERNFKSANQMHSSL